MTAIGTVGFMMLENLSFVDAFYYNIVTMSTVGYGDISPQTGLGQAIAAVIMILGYGLIAVPTGIVTVELTKSSEKTINTQSCPQCSAEGHDNNAIYCKYCGGKLEHFIDETFAELYLRNFN